MLELHRPVGVVGVGCAFKSDGLIDLAMSIITKGNVLILMIDHEYSDEVKILGQVMDLTYNL